MPTPPGRDPRYETLDVWRGVACLMVVLHHSGFYALRWAEAEGRSFEAWARWIAVGFYKNMDLGVPIFFVISGYCIAASMDGHRRRGASPWAFLGRRLRRIYPPYWAALLAFVAVTWSFDRAGLAWLHRGGHSLELKSTGDLDAAQWLGNVTLTEMWRPVVWGGRSFDVFTRVGWSLCYEEQFYLICFLVLLAAPRRLHATLAALTVAIVGFRVVARDVGWISHYRGLFTDYWHEFAVGLAVYWRLVVLPPRSEGRALDLGLLAALGIGLYCSLQSTELVGVIGIGFLLVGLIGHRRQVTSPARSNVFAVDLGLVGLFVVGLRWSFLTTTVASAFGVALIALRGFDEAASRSAWLMPLRACGRRCYSIYLIHLPVCTVGNELLYRLGITTFWAKVLVMTPIVSVLAVGAGWAFFEAVESRFLNMPADRKPHARPVAGELALAQASGQRSAFSQRAEAGFERLPPSRSLVWLIAES